VPLERCHAGKPDGDRTIGLSASTERVPARSALPIRAEHDTYPVSVAVGPSTKKVDNRAPWALGGANYVEFTPAGSGTLTLTFDGADGFAWRAVAVATPMNGGAPTTFRITLDAGSAASVAIGGFGTQWSKVTLVPSIVGTDASAVTYAYGATVN
jgi:hypothetical protein